MQIVHNKHFLNAIASLDLVTEVGKESLGRLQKKTVKLVTLSKKGGRGQENGKIWNVGEKMTFS